jgi:hypothetical protein
METRSKEDIGLLPTNINDKCSQLLEVNIQKTRNHKLVICNIPEEVNMENAEDIIKTQNPEITINAGEVKTKIHIHREKKHKKIW